MYIIYIILYNKGFSIWSIYNYRDNIKYNNIINNNIIVYNNYNNKYNKA